MDEEAIRRCAVKLAAIINGVPDSDREDHFVAHVRIVLAEIEYDKLLAEIERLKEELKTARDEITYLTRYMWEGHYSG